RERSTGRVRRPRHSRFRRRGCRSGSGLVAISQAWAASRSLSDATVDDFLDETLGDGNGDSLTGGTGADLFIINAGDTITDFQFGKPKANKDGDVVIKDGIVTIEPDFRTDRRHVDRLDR